jgi:hypothetical protein
LQGIPLCVASTEDVLISKLEWAKLARSARQLDLESAGGLAGSHLPGKMDG